MTEQIILIQCPECFHLSLPSQAFEYACESCEICLLTDEWMKPEQVGEVGGIPIFKNPEGLYAAGYEVDLSAFDLPGETVEAVVSSEHLEAVEIQLREFEARRAEAASASA